MPLWIQLPSDDGVYYPGRVGDAADADDDIVAREAHPSERAHERLDRGQRFRRLAHADLEDRDVVIGQVGADLTELERDPRLSHHGDAASA